MGIREIKHLHELEMHWFSDRQTKVSTLGIYGTQNLSIVLLKVLSSAWLKFEVSSQALMNGQTLLSL